jgi:hypothetical protein
MAVIYVARSATISAWGSDVGLGKYLYKLGVTAEPVKALVATGWAGATDWLLVKQAQASEGLDEAAAIASVARRDKMIDPAFYPRIKGTVGIFKIPPASVENWIVMAKALAGDTELDQPKPKHPDFAAYLIATAGRPIL